MSDKHKLFCGPGKVRPEFAKQCDINRIMSRWAATGVLDHVKQQHGAYIDCTGIPDYESACKAVIKAQDSFMALPARVRKRFGNNPAEFVAFCQDPDNAAEAAALGLVDKPGGGSASGTDVAADTGDGDQSAQSPT